MFYAEISVKIHLYRQVGEKQLQNLQNILSKDSAKLLKKKIFSKKAAKRASHRSFMASLLGRGFEVFNIYRWDFSVERVFEALDLCFSCGLSRLIVAVLVQNCLGKAEFFV